jgi:hypothetical protein
LPKEFETKYESMYKGNFEERDSKKRMDDQDFAQIFAQLASNAAFADMSVEEMKRRLKSESAGAIL